MGAKREKFLWFTDIHLDRISPWQKLAFTYRILKEKPKGIFLTGDISMGLFLYYDLYVLATIVRCPIYFIRGNHDVFLSSFKGIDEKIKKLCDRFPHLHYLTKSDVIPLNDSVAVIGHDGWFDGYNGNPKYLRFTLDNNLIKDFREIKSMDDKLTLWRKMAKESADVTETKLKRAIDLGYKTIFVLTHFIPFVEATRHPGTLLEKFWLPFNTNISMGTAIKKIAEEYPGLNIITLAGHSHEAKQIAISDNIMSYVGHPGIDTMTYQLFYI